MEREDQMKIRSLWAAGRLPIITLSVYGVAWRYRVSREPANPALAISTALGAWSAFVERRVALRSGHYAGGATASHPTRADARAFVRRTYSGLMARGAASFVSSVLGAWSHGRIAPRLVHQAPRFRDAFGRTNRFDAWAIVARDGASWDE